jgi:hypothetical protein
MTAGDGKRHQREPVEVSAFGVGEEAGRVRWS